MTERDERRARLFSYYAWIGDDLRAEYRDELAELKSLLRRADGSAKWWAEVAKAIGPVEDVE